MKIQYRLRRLTNAERALATRLLLDEMEAQKWYHVVRLEIWRTTGVIVLQ